MGVEMDIEKTFQMSLNKASETLQKMTPAQPSAGWKSFHSKLPKKKNPVPTKPLAHPTLMEKRKSVESIQDYRSSPAAATSLGLSSCAVRIGFATPGSMPSPSMAPLSLGQMSLLSNSHLSSSFPPALPPPPFSTTAENSMSQHTPLQISGNPLQYLLQSRYRSQLHDIEEMKSHDPPLAQSGTGSSDMTPMPHVTKSLFPLTNDQSTVKREDRDGHRATDQMKTQLFDMTPQLSCYGAEGIDVSEVRGDGNDDDGHGRFRTGREIHLKGMATPGLTPIERSFRDEDVEERVLDEPEDLFVYGKSTVKRGEKSELGFTREQDEDEEEEEDHSVDFRHLAHPRDEVRRRVSFGPLIEEKHEGSPSSPLPPTLATTPTNLPSLLLHFPRLHLHRELRE
jgi:hypothetical protein